MFDEVGTAGFSCYNVMPLQKTVAPPPCLPLEVKDLLKEDRRFFDRGLMEGFLMGDWVDRRVAGEAAAC
jgi:hypothetical protein